MNEKQLYASKEFEEQYTYDGELGSLWEREETTFRVWAPTAEVVFVNLYRSGRKGTDDLTETLELRPYRKGVWTTTKKGDLAGIYYTYTVRQKKEFGGQTAEDICDPYARAVGVNGDRAMVVNPESTDPAGWMLDRRPNARKKATEAIIYEAHVRDLTVSEQSGVKAKGKFIGLAESGTVNSYGDSTVLDYIADLGVTHVHLLPVFDFASVDESGTGSPYNWGYDPKNFFAPEGSYATDAFDGMVRIREFKSMVKAFHDKGLGVVMDVVFNHVDDAEEYCFNRIVPGYFSRKDDSGVYSNGSVCGNDTASERSMVRKYIVDNLLYWAEEYHIDGFRFDLVGLLDVDTIVRLERELRSINPDILLYGEGWTMDTLFTREVLPATQNYAFRTPGFAYFSDTIRNLLRGNNFDTSQKGYVSGAEGMGDALKSNLMGAPHWAPSPASVVNYVSCHDDLTLYDKYAANDPEASRETIISRCRLAAAIVFASEGIAFFSSGEELLRRKLNEDGTMNSNTYNCGDAINAIQWDCLQDAECRKQRDLYKALIAFRKAHPVFALTDRDEILSRFSFRGVWESEAVVCTVDCLDLEGESTGRICMIFNPDGENQSIRLEKGNWKTIICTAQDEERLKDISGEIVVPAISAVFLEEISA